MPGLCCGEGRRGCIRASRARCGARGLWMSGLGCGGCIQGRGGFSCGCCCGGECGNRGAGAIEGAAGRGDNARMQISRLEWRGVRIPLRDLHRALDPTKAGRNALIIWMHMDNGVVGFGEAAPVGPGRPPEIADIAGALQDLAGSALGLHPAVACDVLSALAPRGSVGDALRFGVETAAFDAMGKNAGRPVADLLGGALDWSPMVALLDFLPPREAAEQAAEAAAAGYECVKASLGSRDPDDDVEVVRLARRAIGWDVGLRADVDEGWTTERAIYTLERLRPYGLDFVEQPVIAEDLSGMARIRRETGAQVAADEAVGTLEDAERVVASDAADVLVVKAAKAGGIRNGQAIMAYAAAHGLRFTVSSSLETGVGIAASLHLSTSLGKAEPASLGTGVRLESDLLTKPLVPVRGHMAVPHLPGLGVELDLDAVDYYTTDVMGVIAG